MTSQRSARMQFFFALGISCAVSLGLYVYGAMRNHSFGYDYLVWNLFLAFLPLVFALRLSTVLSTKRWSSWEAMGVSVLWLLFLPNSFYMISDFIHIQEVPRVDLLFDVVMFTSFIYNAVVLGFASLYLIHIRLAERLERREVGGLLALTILACSGAIYIGRDLRWNSWDVVTNPGGLLFDISDRVSNPGAYPQMLVTIITFFLLLSSMYFLIWRGVRLLKQLPNV